MSGVNDTDKTLRERLFVFLAEHDLKGDVPIGQLIVAWHKSEFSHAVGELSALRALCRRVAEHLSNEHHIGMRDPAANANLIIELEHSGWTEDGEER